MTKWAVAAVVCCGLSVQAASRLATKEEIEAYTGGTIQSPAKGRVLLLNVQKKVPASTIREAAEGLLKGLSFPFEVKDGTEFSIATAAAIKNYHKANAVVFVVDDPTLPMTLVAQENAWGVVNVAAVEDENASATASRTGKLVYRTLLLALGGMSVPGAKCVTSLVTSLTDLDGVPATGCAMEQMFGVMASGERLGIVPAKTATYREACTQGWAPKPVNPKQQAVWDDVHALPTEPIRIQPKSKKGK